MASGCFQHRGGRFLSLPAFRFLFLAFEDLEATRHGRAEGVCA
jgi:hypothetical protein